MDIYDAVLSGNTDLVKKLIDEDRLCWMEALDAAIEYNDMEMVRLIINESEHEQEFVGEYGYFADKYYKWLEKNYLNEYIKEYDNAIEKNMKFHKLNVMNLNEMIFKNKFEPYTIKNTIKINEDSLMDEFKLKLMKLYNIRHLKNVISNEDVMEMYRYEAAGC